MTLLRPFPSTHIRIQVPSLHARPVCEQRRVWERAIGHHFSMSRKIKHVTLLMAKKTPKLRGVKESASAFEYALESLEGHCKCVCPADGIGVVLLAFLFRFRSACIPVARIRQKKRRKKRILAMQEEEFDPPFEPKKNTHFQAMRYTHTHTHTLTARCFSFVISRRRYLDA